MGRVLRAKQFGSFTFLKSHDDGSLSKSRLNIGLKLNRTAEMDREALRIDSLVPWDASMNLEKEEKDRCSKKIRCCLTYRGDKHWQAFLLQMDVNNIGLCHGISSHTCPRLPLDFGSYGKLSEGELDFNTEAFCIKHKHEVLTVMHGTWL